MPQHKSAAKRMRTSEKSRQRNRAVKSHLKKVLKQVDAAAPEDSAAALRDAVSALDRAAKKGVIHERQVDRRKSRLARRVQAQAADAG
jgi:small subunit ribosomal protein S20